MSDRSKELRRKIIDNFDDNPKARHSLNQKSLHKDIESEERFFGLDHKGAKAEEKRARDQWYQEDYPTARWQLQRSLEAIFDGRATPEHIEYVATHLDDFTHPLRMTEVSAVGLVEEPY